MSYRLRTWGGGWGWLGKDVVVTDQLYWWLAGQGRLRYSIGETVRRRLHNRAVGQHESYTHLGADAATISFDQTEDALPAALAADKADKPEGSRHAE